MSPERMAEAAERFIRESVSRVGPDSVGAKQYYDPTTDLQAFESFTPRRMLEYFREELYDVANYAMMTDVLFTRIVERLEQDYVSREEYDALKRSYDELCLEKGLTT